MTDSLFEKSVIYICEHNDDGAMGLIINKSLSQKELDGLSQINENLSIELKSSNNTFLGGPVLIENIIVLHTNDIVTKNAVSISNKISISSDKTILKKISNVNKSKYKIFFGHSGWNKGQLEREIKNGDWLIQKSSIDLIFDMPKETIWEHATRSLGIEINDISSFGGSA
jgi:putative transcriptional regulator